MMCNKTKGQKKYYIYFTISVCILLYVCLTNLQKLSSPYFVPDEMGYWTAGAWLNGLNWSSVMSTGGYYAYGYGILLAGLFPINSPILMFRCAIVINVLMLLGSYALLLRTSSRLFTKINKNIRLLLCLTATLYTPHIVYSQLTQTEIFLTFLFLLSVELLCSICEKPTRIKCIGLALVIFIMFSVHMRTIVMAISSGICLVYLAVKKRVKITDVCVFFGLVALGMTIMLMVKQNLINSQYTNQMGEVLTYNDFSGRIGIFKTLLSKEGILRLALGLLSKVFYLGCSTFMLFYWALFVIGKQIYGWLRDKCRYSLQTTVYCYILMSCAAGILVGSIWMLTPSRADQVEYARYFENLIAYVVLIGGFALFENRIKAKQIVCAVIVHVFLCEMTFYSYGINHELTAPLLLQITGIASYTKLFTDPSWSFTWGACLATTFVGGIIAFFSSRKNVKIQKATFIGLSLLWILMGLNVANEIYNKRNEYKSIEKIAEAVKECDGNVYYIVPPKMEGSEFFDMYNLQFDMLRKPLLTIKECDFDVKDLKYGDYLVVHRNLEIPAIIIKDFQYRYSNNKFVVFEYGKQ